MRLLKVKHHSFKQLFVVNNFVMKCIEYIFICYSRAKIGPKNTCAFFRTRVPLSKSYGGGGRE